MRYRLAQSSDQGAFEELTSPRHLRTYSMVTSGPPRSVLADADTDADAEQRVGFGAVSNHTSELSPIEIRGRALKDVETRSKVTSSGGRMKGKVGIITGVGPVAGIGVSSLQSTPIRMASCVLIDSTRPQRPRSTPEKVLPTYTSSTSTRPSSLLSRNTSSRPIKGPK